MTNNVVSSRTIQILLFLTLLTAYSYFLPRWADWSQNSRIDLTRAIVEQGRLEIDDYYQNTGDYAHFEGHYYSDKAPGPALLAVPFYAIARPILQSGPVQNLMERMAQSSAFSDTLTEGGTGLQEGKIYGAAVLYIATFFVSVIPSAILGVLVYRFIVDLGAKHARAVFAALIYGLATNAFAYAGAFFSHQLVAFLLFGAFYIGFQIKRENIGPRWVILAGFMLGYAIISEYPSFLVAVGVFLYIIWTLYKRMQWGWIGAFLLSGLPPGIILMAYDLAIFHTIFPIGYNYSELYTDLHSTGFLSLTYPHPEALWGITFSSYRGLFFIAPVLLLAVAGLWAWWRSGTHRAEWIVCLWATIGLLLFNGSSVMWEGGYGVGPRYVVPMLPFFAAGLAAFTIRWRTSSRVYILTAILTMWSLFAVWAQTVGGQNYPPWDTNPLFSYSIPKLIEGEVARNLGMVLGLSGLSSILPLLILMTLLIAALFRYTYAHLRETTSTNLKFTQPVEANS